MRENQEGSLQKFMRENQFRELQPAVHSRPAPAEEGILQKFMTENQEGTLQQLPWWSVPQSGATKGPKSPPESMDQDDDSQEEGIVDQDDDSHEGAGFQDLQYLGAAGPVPGFRLIGKHFMKK
jgi:hypothetical protein